jgi:bifunctional non-homologous end joining protein LigD
MPVAALKRVRVRELKPEYLEPCAATNIGRPPVGDRWLHEIKYDGFRFQAHVGDGQAVFFSRGGHDWTKRVQAVADEAAALGLTRSAFDGEMVVLREDGTCDFFALQSAIHGMKSDRLTYFAFDILFHEGKDVRRLPLIERKELLREVLKDSGPRIRYVDHVDLDGPTVWAHAHNVNVEGIVSKRARSTYLAHDWIKTPCQYRETLYVAGMCFDENKFAGLYLARRKNRKLVYAGMVEDGFPHETAAEVRARLEPLITNVRPLENFAGKDARWVHPSVKVRIVHRGGMDAERVRRAVFEGLVAPSAAVKKAKPSPSPNVPAQNIQRLLDDAEVPTVAQLKAHWRKYGKQALEHVGHRPLTLVRHVDGVTFFHHGPLPETAASVHKLSMVKADGTKGTRLWVDSVQGLLALVDIGVVEVHPWAARVDDIERPDQLIFDLDPGQGIEWPFVVETTLALRDMLAREGLESWPKLTGGFGMHVMAPIERDLTHKEVHRYALDLAGRIAARKPRKYTTTAGASHRVGKLFIDHLRNGRGFTAIGTFSPRARKGLPAACPTTWKAVERGERRCLKVGSGS